MFILRGVLPVLLLSTTIASVEVSAAGLTIDKCASTLTKQSNDEKWTSLKSTILKCRTTVQKEIDAGNKVSSTFKKSLVQFTDEHNENARKAIAGALYFDSDGKLDKKQKKARDNVRKALKKLHDKLNGSGKKTEKSLNKLLASVDKSLKKFSASQYTKMRNNLAGQIGSALSGAATQKFEACVERLNKSNLEKNILKCGGLLQTMLDEKQSIDFDGMLAQLNDKIETINLDSNQASIPYELHKDTIDKGVGRNIKLINNLRNLIREYRSLGALSQTQTDRAKAAVSNNTDNRGGAAGMMLLQNVAQHQVRVYSKIETTLASIKQKVPSFDTTNYEKTIASIKSAYDSSTTNASGLVALKSSMTPLSTLATMKAITGGSHHWAATWRKVMPLTQVQEIKNSSPTAEVEEALSAYDAEYKKAQANTEKAYLMPLLDNLYQGATVYKDPNNSYFITEYSDSDMKDALADLQEETKGWLALLPESSLLQKYNNDMQQTIAKHKTGMKKGHEMHKARVLAAVSKAKVPTTDYKQDAQLQELINRIAKKRFNGNAELNSVLNETVKTSKMMLTAKQSQAWGIFKNDLDIPTSRVTNFITVVKDVDDNCHAVSLRVDSQYAGGGTWNEAYISDVIQDYPLECNRL